MLNAKIMTMSGQRYRDLSTWPEFTTVVSFSYYSDWGVTGIDMWSYEPRVITLPTGVSLKFANYMCGDSDWPILCDITGETALVPRVIKISGPRGTRNCTGKLLQVNSKRISFENAARVIADLSSGSAEPQEATIRIKFIGWG